MHLHPQTQAGGEVDLTPLLRAVEDAATEQATARQNASWRLMCERMVAAERKRWRDAVMLELDSNGQARAIVADATGA